MKFYFLPKANLNSHPERGQTLIETLAAIFILVMGITAAVGLAIYALNSSSSITKQIIATGLAREGLEAVRNMRDTNWLNDTLSVDGCYNFDTGQSNQADCYKHWLGTNGPPPAFCLDPSNGNPCNGNTTDMDYSLAFDSTSINFWVLQKQKTQQNYGMTFLTGDLGNSGIYFADGSTPCANASNIADYCRKIVLSKDTSDPKYQQDVGPLLLVKSQVWWVDKKCPRAADFDQADPSCRVELDTYLTNWKNY